MILGNVDAAGAPVLRLTIDGRDWKAVVDTGFNGDLELPYALGPSLNARFFARGRADLAGGQSVEED